MRCLPLKKKNILLFSYYGEHYSGSPKYISEFLQKKNGLNIIWAFTKPNIHEQCNTKKVKYNSFAFYYYLATSATIITNYRMPLYFLKRNNQKYIQTWHSSLRLKMIEKDAESTLPENYVEMAKNDSKQISVLLAGSLKSREIFERAFWYSGKILNTGTPQCDLFFNNTESYSTKVHKHFNIDCDCKIALYAPTFRKNNNLEVYNLNYEELLESLENRFGGKWVVLLRLHPHLINTCLNTGNSNRVLQATTYDDVQEMLCASDILISDYSAIMFDFMCLKRPCFLYTPDYEEYISNDRNLYFDLKELPFVVAENQQTLNSEISNFNKEQYENNLNKFLYSIGSFDDGHACERVYEEIINFNK